MAGYFGFTKIVVNDLDAAARFYGETFDLNPVVRHDAQVDKIGEEHELFVNSEIIFAASREGGANFVLLQYPGRQATVSGEVILGFITDDIASLLDRATAVGGSIVTPPRAMPEHGVTVAFIKDTDGHLIEVVEMLI